MVLEIRKEHRDTTRRCVELVPYHQVEYYRQNSLSLREWYPRHLDWWDDTWISQNMLVPFRPIMTHRARHLLVEHTPEGKLWWKVFETECTTLIFARWCTDIVQRHLMWGLPNRIRENINRMTVEDLLKGSPYSVATVLAWL
jgi:hypothetical protein